MSETILTIKCYKDVGIDFARDSDSYSLFVAVIVDNLARTQAAANAAKPKKIPGLHKKVCYTLDTSQVWEMLAVK